MGDVYTPDHLRRQRGQTLLEVLTALAVMGLGIAACVRLLVYSVSAQSVAAERERLAWRVADAGELVQAWPDAPAPTHVAEWQQDALAPVPSGAVRDGEATLRPASDATPALRRWHAGITWSTGDALGTRGSFAAFLHATAPPP